MKNLYILLLVVAILGCRKNEVSDMSLKNTVDTFSIKITNMSNKYSPGGHINGIIYMFNGSDHGMSYPTFDKNKIYKSGNVGVAISYNTSIVLKTTCSKFKIYVNCGYNNDYMSDWIDSKTKEFTITDNTKMN